MRSTLVLFTLLLACSPPFLGYDDKIQDASFKQEVLTAVSSYIQFKTKGGRPLFVKTRTTTRKFKVVEIFDAVTRDNNIYTAQVDVDEAGNKLPRLLFFDVETSNGVFKVTRIRIGPNHLRQK